VTRITADFSEVNRLAADIGKIPGRAVPASVAIVTKGALNIKQDAQTRIRGQLGSPTHLPHYPNAIDFDIRYGVGRIEAEIGPNSAMPQGGMGAPIEEGGIRTAPMPHMGPALEAEGPKFEKALGDMVEGFL
jgi:hypothetical protein